MGPVMVESNLSRSSYGRCDTPLPDTRHAVKAITGSSRAIHLPIPYITDHPISRTVMSAVAAGLGIAERSAHPASWTPDPLISYGVLRGTSELFWRNEQAQVDWWHLDLGYWARGHFDGYYRLSYNGTHDPYPLICSAPRIPLPELPPLAVGDGPIVVCPPTLLYSVNNPLYHMNSNLWEDAVCRTISTLTDRPVMLRRKEESQDQPFPKTPYCVVVYNSNVAVDALIRGTPAISLAPGILSNSGPKLHDINNPTVLQRDYRTELLTRLSWAQFTLDEFREGLPWRLYNADYGTNRRHHAHDRGQETGSFGPP